MLIYTILIGFNIKYVDLTHFLNIVHMLSWQLPTVTLNGASTEDFSKVMVIYSHLILGNR